MRKEPLPYWLAVFAALAPAAAVVLWNSYQLLTY